MHNYEKASIALSIASLVAGILLSLYYDQTYFQRSGVVVICIAITFSAKYIVGTIEDRIFDYSELIDINRSSIVSDLMQKHDCDIDTAERTLDECKNAVLSEESVKLIPFKSQAVKIEASLLIIGTLVSGFGDLIFVLKDQIN